MSLQDWEGKAMNVCLKQTCSIILAMFYAIWFDPLVHAYSFNMLVPDARQPTSVSGGSACPVRASAQLRR